MFDEPHTLSLTAAPIPAGAENNVSTFMQPSHMEVTRIQGSDPLLTESHAGFYNSKVSMRLFVFIHRQFTSISLEQATKYDPLPPVVGSCRSRPRTAPRGFLRMPFFSLYRCTADHEAPISNRLTRDVCWRVAPEQSTHAYSGKCTIYLKDAARFYAPPYRPHYAKSFCDEFAGSDSHKHLSLIQALLEFHVCD